jgi:hypothetical protein
MVNSSRFKYSISGSGVRHDELQVRAQEMIDGVPGYGLD